jgi:hypothetical protein
VSKEFVEASKLPASLMARDFKRFMRELRDGLLEAGVYIDRIRAVVAEGEIVTVYGDAIVVEYHWLEKRVVKLRERL